jgi:hypothetical protein
MRSPGQLDVVGELEERVELLVELEDTILGLPAGAIAPTRPRVAPPPIQRTEGAPIKIDRQ